YKFRFSIEIFRNRFGCFFVECLVDCCKYTAIHQLPLHVFGQYIQFLGQIFDRQSFRQRNLPKFTDGFRLWLRTHKRCVQLLLGVSLITLCPVRALLRLWTPLLYRLWRWWWRSSRTDPGTRSRRSGWCRASVLEPRAGWMPWLTGPRAHWSLLSRS